MKEEIWNELYLYLIRIEIGVPNISRNVLARPVMGTIFLVVPVPMQEWSRNTEWGHKYERLRFS